jgi:hypothetical protein
MLKITKRKPTAKRKAAPVTTKPRRSVADRQSTDDLQRNARSPAAKTATTKQHGGHRAGVGRKVSVEGGRKQLTINLNAHTVAALEPHAARKVEQIVEQYVANLKP